MAIHKYTPGLRDAVTYAINDTNDSLEGVTKVSSISEIGSTAGIKRLDSSLFVVGDDSVAIGVSNKRSSALVLSAYGDSTSNMGSATTATSNDVSSFADPLPVTSKNVTMGNVIANMVALLYPSKFGTNCGVDGRTCATMVTDEQSASTSSTRKVVDLTNTGSNVVLYSGGSINDLTAATYSGGVINETNYQTLVTNHKKIISYLLSCNIDFVIDFGVLGYSRGLSGITGSPPSNSDNGNGVRNALLRFNAEIEQYISSLNSDRIRFFNPLGKSCDSTGAFLTGYVRTSDGVHPDYWGIYNISQYVRDMLKQKFGNPPNIVYPGKNVARNAMMASVSSGWPTDWAININSNGSIVSGTRQIEVIDGVNWATAKISAIAAGNVNFFVKLPFNPSDTDNGTIPALNVSIGDKYGIEFDFFIEPESGLSITNMGVFQYYERHTSVGAGNPYLQNTLNFSQVTTDVVNHGRIEYHGHMQVIFQEAGSAYLNTGCWVAAFSTQTLVAASAGERFKIGVSGYRVVKL